MGKCLRRESQTMARAHVVKLKQARTEYEAEKVKALMDLVTLRLEGASLSSAASSSSAAPILRRATMPLQDVSPADSSASSVVFCSAHCICPKCKPAIDTVEVVKFVGIHRS